MSKSKRQETDRESFNPENITIAIICLVAGYFISFALLAYTPLHNLVPGYPTPEELHIQAQNAMRLDSLERSVYRWELYSENLRRVVEGGRPLQADSLIRRAAVEVAERNRIALTATDSTLRSYVQKGEKSDVTDKNREMLRIEGLHFFAPLVGAVSRRYEMAHHPYVDITAPEGTTVKSVLDGSVLYTSWNEADNWSIVIQHQNGIISIYKHNQKLLKHETDIVGAGSPIGLLGRSAAIDKDDTHLHFELWQNGSPLDPTLYIDF